MVMLVFILRDLMVKLSRIDFKIGLPIDPNVNEGHNKLGADI